MNRTLTFFGQALLLFAVTWAFFSAGSLYASRVSEVSKGQNHIRRTFSPIPVSMSAAGENNIR